MATSNHNAGLLSRVARFVRRPTRDWFESGTAPREPDSVSQGNGAYSRQSLKEMIEQKRRNDIVRRREFDHLRKLLRNIPVTGAELAERTAGAPGSTISELDERVKTLQKIDEIEAHMSSQWWQGKTDAAPLRDSAFRLAPGGPPLAADNGSAAAVPGPMGGAFGPTLPFEPDSPFDAPQRTAVEATVPSLSRSPGAQGSQEGQPLSALRCNRPGAIDPGANLADPDLEEAAIHFANGDDAGAEQCLWSALGAAQVDPDLASRWLQALAELYRVTGQSDGAARVASERARRFGSHAPSSIMAADLLPSSADGASLVAQPLRSPSPVPWQCPAQLDLPEVQAMQATQAMHAELLRAAQPWHLDWSRLANITADAGRALAQQFARWCTQDVELHFAGADVLQAVLRRQTPPNDRQCDLFWWQLRFAALCLMRLPDEFELTALDYCVLFEVSPSPWQEARCDYIGATVAGEITDTRRVVAPPVAPAPRVAASVELSGELIGEVSEKLDALRAGASDGHRLVISCARLTRVDFAAAGSVLDWVMVRESEGFYIQFRHVSCLVAAFFQVIGIHEHARVLSSRR